MNFNRLEQLPSIAPLPPPRQNHSEWVIPGYSLDISYISGAAGGLLILLGFPSVISAAIALRKILESSIHPSVVVIGFLIGCIALGIVGIWIELQLSNLWRLATAGKIRLSTYPLQLGETYTFSCRQELYPNKPLTTVAQWTIQLIGAEVVTFGQSSRPSHERWVLHQETLHEQILPIGTSPDLVATCQFKLPSTGLPSFEAPHNRIRWQIESNLKFDDNKNNRLTRKSEYVLLVEADLQAQT
jgi:hypothetical protein